MSEIDGAVKVAGASTAVIACPLLDGEGKPCRWSTPAEPPATEAAKLIEWAAPGQFQVSSKAYATWYATVDRTVKVHLEQAHTVEEWAATMAAFRNEHHAALDHLHAGYSDRINDLTERLARAERGRDERTRQLNEAGVKIDRLEREAAELGETAERLAASEGEIRALRYERALLGKARLVLDEVADGDVLTPEQTAQLREAAEVVAQQIVDEIGHPVTDEPAIGPDLRALVATKEAALAARDDLIKAWIAKYDKVAAKLVQLEELTVQPRPMPTVTAIRAAIRDGIHAHPTGLSEGMDAAAVAVARLLEGQSGLLEQAWVLIANAGVPMGNWDSQGPDWVKAAVKWRQGYHAPLDAAGVPLDLGEVDRSHPESTRSTTAPAVIAPVQSDATELVE